MIFLVINDFRNKIKNMHNKCKRLFLIFVIFSTTTSVFAVSKFKTSQHEFGLSYPIYYEYEEPKLMYLRSGLGEDDREKNIGLIYNYKNSFLFNNYLTEFEFDNSFQFFKQNYWSNGTGTMKDIDVEVFNSRLLYGIVASDKLMIKAGLGYRHLYHYWQNRQSTTGAWGYDREQDYTYIPIIAELKMPIPELDLNGTLKVEFDYIIEGNNTSYLGYLGGANTDKDFKNDDGYTWKVSYKFDHSGISYEPYYEFMSVEESNVVGGSYEPSNTTTEYGLKVTKLFGEKKSESDSNHKTIFNNEKYYFGIQALFSEVESGLYATTGTAKIEEEDIGFSIVSGMRVLNNINNLPIDLDIEVAFNQFGESILSANNGDTFKTDGRFQRGKYANGTTLTLSVDNYSSVIESYSTSLGIKPSFNFDNTFFIDEDHKFFVSAIVGLARWDQSELAYNSGNNYATNNYSGIDSYVGFGIGLKKGNFSMEVEHLEHDMYYDAKSFTTSFKYIF